MRARMALVSALIKVALREVLLSKKPSALLQLSPKATVPVLQIDKHSLLDESLDIMFWALTINDPNHWLQINTDEGNALISQNDNEFKSHLDNYKYADRFTEFTEQQYRQRGEVFLKQLEQRLIKSDFLMGDNASYVDVAIFPFIRQFASVDKKWFETSPYIKTNKWLSYWLASDCFKAVMIKHTPWQEGDKQVVLPV